MSAAVLANDAAPRRRSCILGTAGHVDHGKSSLVKALTGTDPDRLEEEKARGMTIVLGYAHLELPGPDGQALQIGIVDVPGHERFVRTMVAGATGIDMGMLVVAADDGVMPQTCEHVDILHLLGVQIGLIALSKIDLVPPDRLAIVKNQIADLVSGTSLLTWPIVPVSVKSGSGIDDLRACIARRMGDLPPRATGSIFRVAIDRVFTIHGRGTVVTGSVLCGWVTAGTTLELSPAGVPCKVREVQSYGAMVKDAAVGQRVALNLTGIEKHQIERGMELATPGYLTPSRYVDASVRILKRRTKPWASHRRVRVCLGAGEAMASMVIAGRPALSPGEEAFAQLRFDQPVVGEYGQRFILRNETSEATLGGGIIVRPVSRRFGRDAAMDSLARANHSDAFVRFEEAMRQAGFEARSDLRLSCEAGVDPKDIEPMRTRLREAGRLSAIGGSAEFHASALAALVQRAERFLKRHHAEKPAEPGVQRDRFITWLGKKGIPAAGNAMLAHLETTRRVVVRGPYVAHVDFRPNVSDEDAKLLDRIVAELTTARFDPPLWAQLQSTVAMSTQRLKSLEEIAKTDSRLLPIAPGHYISRIAMDEVKAAVAKVGTGRKFKLAEVRDALALNRRAVQVLLEHLDRVGFTKRIGDERVLLGRPS